MTTAIAWGEADVRDCMAEFDPDPADWPPPSSGHANVGVRGVRGQVVAYAYWGKNRLFGGFVIGPGDVPHRYFTDPVEAVQYAIALARGE